MERMTQTKEAEIGSPSHSLNFSLFFQRKKHYHPHHQHYIRITIKIIRENNNVDFAWESLRSCSRNAAATEAAPRINLLR